MDSLLSVYDLCRQGTRALGPGLRYVVWTQGCPFSCEGCATPESRPVTHDNQVLVSDLVRDVLSRPDIDGITLSGGEPFLQSESLAVFLEQVLLERPELTVISFTGYSIGDLTCPSARRLLERVDLLIDGPYIPALNDNTGLRGSSNQGFHYLTDRLVPWKEELERGRRRVEYHLQEGVLKGFGIPSADMII